MVFGLKGAYIVSSWDDGHPLDMKLSALLEKYGISATFYMPIKNSKGIDVLNKEQLVEISEKFEIGGHTYHHVDLTSLSLENAEREIKSGKKTMEEIIGEELRSFCYPIGKYNDNIIDMVKMAGFTNARTVRLLEKEIVDPFQIGTTAHVTEKGLTHFSNYLLKSEGLPNKIMVTRMLMNNLLFKDWYGCATMALDHIVKEGGIFHIWGHSWEIEAFGQWERLELFFKRIHELEDSGQVTLKTVSEILANR